MSIETENRSSIKQQFLDTLPEACKRHEEGLARPVVCKNAARLACTMIDNMPDEEGCIDDSVANYAGFVSCCPGLEHVGTSCTGKYVCKLDEIPCFSDLEGMQELAEKLIDQK